MRRVLDDIERLAGVGCWEWDVAADRVTWTDELYRIYGLSADEFPATYEGYLSRVHPDDRARVAAAIDAAYRQGAAFEFEERIVRPDGAVRRLRSRGRVERAGDGAALRLVGVCHDITELHAAQEQALRYAEERAARRQAEAASARQQFLADATEILASSLDYETTLGNVARLAVPTIADWCAVDLLDAGAELRRVAVEHPDPARVRLAHRLSEEYPPARDESRGALRVLATGESELVEHIPDQLLAAAAQDERHLAILRELGLGSYVIAPLRVKDRTLGVMTFVHAESGRRFGAADLPLLEDLARRGAVAIENAHLVRDLEEAHRRVAEQREELEVQAEELELQTEELQATMHELEQRNDELDAQRVDAETARASAELANRAKSQFLATMSHELRTPLNAIAGYSELLDLGVHGPVTQQQREAIRRIQRNQRRLLSLITDVLNFTRIDAGHLRVAQERVSINALLQELEPIVAPQAEAKGIRLRLHNGPDASALADAERAEQVLLNLLSNAIKFTARGGRIDVAVDEIDAVVRIRVSDTGRGIPPEKLEAIFDPFVQVDGDLTRESDGVGLGLSISRELARAMGGELTVSSEPGRGSDFVFTVPAAATP